MQLVAVNVCMHASKVRRTCLKEQDSPGLRLRPAMISQSTCSRPERILDLQPQRSPCRFQATSQPL